MRARRPEQSEVSTAHFFTSEEGYLGYVKVTEHGIKRVAYDSDKEDAPAKTAKESAVDAGKSAGDAVKKLFHHQS